MDPIVFFRIGTHLVEAVGQVISIMLGSKSVFLDSTNDPLIPKPLLRKRYIWIYLDPLGVTSFHIVFLSMFYGENAALPVSGPLVVFRSPCSAPIHWAIKLVGCPRTLRGVQKMRCALDILDAVACLACCKVLSIIHSYGRSYTSYKY